MSDELSPEYQQYLRKVFKEFDDNGDQIMTKEELKNLMVALGQDLDDQKIDKLLQNIDLDKNGLVDINQFLSLMQLLLERVQPSKQLKRAFCIFDRDGNGQISIGQLKQVMQSLGQQLNQNEIRQLMLWIEAQGAQTMNYEMFAKLIMRQNQPKK